MRPCCHRCQRLGECGAILHDGAVASKRHLQCARPHRREAVCARHAPRQRAVLPRIVPFATCRLTRRLCTQCMSGRSCCLSNQCMCRSFVAFTCSFNTTTLCKPTEIPWGNIGVHVACSMFHGACEECLSLILTGPPVGYSMIAQHVDIFEVSCTHELTDFEKILFDPSTPTRAQLQCWRDTSDINPAKQVVLDFTFDSVGTLYSFVSELNTVWQPWFGVEMQLESPHTGGKAAH
eukprot:m.1387438 g.1387438  ORF g.1387438 m.1387438 type:complete len:235 (-) comp24982_c0_seq10:2024-2728(-)